MVLASSDLPAHLNDRLRFGLWREMFAAEVAPVDFAMSDQQSFAVTSTAVAIGPVEYAKTYGTISRGFRTAREIAADRFESYAVFINAGATKMGGTYRQQELEIAPGGAFLDASEPQEIVGGNFNSWMNVRIPKDVVHASFPKIGARQGLTIDPGHEALGLMKNYLQFIDGHAQTFSPSITDHVAGTIIDLIGLATGAKGDEAELAGLRGLRAARLQAVLAHIRRHYTRPNLSAELVGRTLGLSARYIQDLLAVTGSSFSERVLELRLQHAKQMLGDPENMEMRIGDVVFASGFGDVSYFNRSFRRRFGCSPGSSR